MKGARFDGGLQWRSACISLDGLLDYDEGDRDEATLELSLFAEAFQDMLMRDYGTIILNCLQAERYGRLLCSAGGLLLCDQRHIVAGVQARCIAGASATAASLALFYCGGLEAFVVGRPDQASMWQMTHRLHSAAQPHLVRFSRTELQLSGTAGPLDGWRTGH